MNCVKGDLAVIVRSWSGNDGKIIRCVGFMGAQPWYEHGRGWVDEATWEIDQELPNGKGFVLNQICDSQLRPIRDQPGADESLTWAGRPAELPADVIREVTA